MLLGDFNAAPSGGRWGFAKWSSAAKEDCAMNGWTQKAGLTKILSGTNPQSQVRALKGLNGQHWTESVYLTTLLPLFRCRYNELNPQQWLITGML